jgi:hypothetical protein
LSLSLIKELRPIAAGKVQVRRSSMSRQHQEEPAEEEEASQIPAQIQPDSSFNSARGKEILIEEKEC